MQVVGYMLSNVFHNLSNFMLCGCEILCQDLMYLRSTENASEIKMAPIVYTCQTKNTKFYCTVSDVPRELRPCSFGSLV